MEDMTLEETLEELDEDKFAEWLADYMIEHNLSPEYTGEESICDELD